MELLALIAGTTAVAWLVPNHYLPWTAAWAEALSLAGICALGLWAGCRIRVTARISWLLLAAAAVAIVTVFGQRMAGHIGYSGDALMSVFYLLIWLLAVLVGQLLASAKDPGKQLEPLLVAWLLAAIMSVGIGLIQWTGSFDRSIYIVDLPPNHAPWANVASRTHFASICFIGLCCLGWLHQRARIGGVGLALGTAFLLLGMVMTTARIAWLQMAWLLPLLLVFRNRAGLRLSAGWVFAIAALFVGLVLAWPVIAETLLLSTGRSRDDQLSSGFRLQHWSMMLDAISRAPWFGYGWGQISHAQQLVALSHPVISEQIDSSHNLVLDLLLWNGIPIGLSVVALLLAWFCHRVFSCRDAQGVWMLAAVGGLLGHSMVEYPLQYAYFLIPAGLLMGAVDAVAGGQSGLRVSRNGLLAGTAILTIALFGIGRDYLRAEEDHRILRLESARIGVDGVVTPAPDLLLLDQLEAYLEAVRIEPTPGMDQQAIDRLRKVADRFGHLTVMFNYALAAGLNGQPNVAADQLARLCRIHLAKDCSLVLRRWDATAQSIYPQLRSIVVPAVP